MGRWRNVKDSFMRSQRKRAQSGQAAETSRKYIFTRQLDFLMGTRENTSAGASSQVEEKDVEAVGEDSPVDVIGIPGTTRADPPQRRAATTGPSRKRQIQDDLITVMQQRPITTAAPDDDDRAFFNSLLPMIREFTPDQKLELRVEILNLIRRVRIMPTPIHAETQQFYTAAQSTPYHPHHPLQTAAPYLAGPSIFQIPPHSYTSIPQIPPSIPPREHTVSPSSGAQSTTFHPHRPLQTSTHPADPSISQIPTILSYTSTPQISPLATPSGEYAQSSSSLSQHSQYDLDLYPQ